MDRINLLRVVAVWLVFALHASLFNGANFQAGELFKEYWWTFIFKTPAWAGCWIFFILSGYLNAKTFINKVDSLNNRNIMDYYQTRFTKILLPTIIFIFICALFVYPLFILENWKTLIIKFFSLTYNGNPGVDGIGATWFVFTVMWLYILTPIFIFFIRKLKNNKSILSFGIIILLLGLIYRLLAFHYSLNWYDMVYTPFFANLDLYISGILVAYIQKNIKFQIKQKYNSFVCLILVGFIILNSYIYSNDLYMIVYMYIFPSLYILLISLYLFTAVKSKSITKLGKVINFISYYSFEFYLFHSLILSKISPYVTGTTAFLGYVKLLLFTIILTFMCSFGFKKMIINVENK